MTETNPSGSDKGRLVLLHPNDNVMICATTIGAGSIYCVDGVDCIASTEIQLGHKVARRALEAGEQVIRYGVPIGTMTASVAVGEHIHRHNLVSDYIPSHDRAVLRKGADVA